MTESFEFDEECYIEAVFRVLGQKIDTDWSKYDHVTDTGILDRHLKLNKLFHQRDEIHSKVKNIFIENIRNHISQSPVQAIEGAIEFVNSLKKMSDVSLSIATGGWGETAIMKLNSAGYDIAKIPIASSNDHYSRIEIMKHALNKSGVTLNDNVTYFGDAEWDQHACEKLNINFVLVGNRTIHNQNIDNFRSCDEAYNYIGL